MNVIDAAFELGRELSASYVRNGGQAIDADFLSGLFGNEISVRLGELFDSQCTKWGLFGYRQSVEILSSMETDGDEASPLNYWIPVISASKSNEVLLRAVEAMRQEGTRCGSLIQMALQGETSLSDKEYPLGVCDAYTTLCSVLRRTGVFRSVSKCLAEANQGGCAHLMEATSELEEAFNQSFAHYVDGSIADKYGMGDAFTALKDFVFLSSLMEKAVFWGFENHRPITDVSQCASVPDFDGGIHEMRLTTRNMSVAFDRVFSALAVTDGGRLKFFLVPYRKEMNFMNEIPDIAVTGVSYPASDVKLFDVSS